MAEYFGFSIGLMDLTGDGLVYQLMNTVCDMCMCIFARVVRPSLT